MKKSRLFMGAGALVLAVSAIFATKANKKFTYSHLTGYSSSSANLRIETATGAVGGWLTTKNTGNPAFVTISTSSGSLVLRTQLLTGASSGKKLLYYYQ